jgi:integrase
MSTKGRGSLYKAKYRDRKTGERCESPYWSMSYQAYRDGKWVQVRKSTGRSKRSDAVKVLNRIMAKQQRREDSGYTLERGIEALNSEYTVRRQRWSRARLSCDKLLAHFGPAAKLGEMRKRDLRDFRDTRLASKTRLCTPPSPATVNRDLAILRAILNLAAEYEEIETVPSFKRLMLEENNSDTAQYISPEELREMEPGMPEHAALAIRFLYVSGLRVRDALRLPWSDVDMEEGWIRVYDEKKNRHRELPILSPIRVVLERLWERRAEVAKKTGRIPELIFTADDGKPFTYWRLRRPWEDARGDRRLRLHDLRASCVTNLHKAGIPSLQSKEWTGHSGVEVHDRYLVTDRVAMGEIGAKYEALLEPALGETAECAAEQKDLVR